MTENMFVIHLTVRNTESEVGEVEDVSLDEDFVSVVPHDSSMNFRPDGAQIASRIRDALIYCPNLDVGHS